MTRSNLIAIDVGTTNTRVWRMHDGAIVAEARSMVGVRDVAREGHARLLYEALRDSIEQVRNASSAAPQPQCVAAAGMITSALGLRDVPHLESPTGLRQLAEGLVTCQFPEITDLPIVLVPGVRTGPLPRTLDNAPSTDIMRGEETLCIGLLCRRRVAAPATVLNLGSHWKVIEIGGSGEICASHTSLTGELLHATQTQTILASSVAQQRPSAYDSHWIMAGARAEQQRGITRSLFEVRLLEQSQCGSPEQRWAYVLGAYLSQEVRAWQQRKLLSSDRDIVIVGPDALNDVVATYVRASIKHSRITSVTSDDAEAAWRHGLQALITERFAHTSPGEARELGIDASLNPS